MQIANSNCHWLAVVIVQILALTLVPISHNIVWAAEQGATASGSVSDESQTGAAGGAATGVGVSGSPSKASPSGKGALAPPPIKRTEDQPSPVKSAEQKESPKAIGASASAAGTADTDTAGVSMGWKITGAVLGVGLLFGLAGGGGGGGGGSTPAHTP